MSTTTVTATTPAASRTVARTIAPAAVLGGIVLVSAVARMLVAWQHASPIIFPDEYIYAALGQGFAHGSVGEIRGASAHFGALLAPLVTAPAWLLHDPVLAYRAVQALNAVAMSLAAVPVYLLGRKLRLSPAISLAAAALAVALASLDYVGNVLAEPYAYPLALGAVLAGVSALERPSRRAHALFLALALLATLARLQFVALPPAFAVAAVAVGLRERRLRAALREQLPTIALCLAGAVVLAVAGVGYYSGALKLGSPAARIESAGSNLLVLAVACGWVIVPGALLGLGYAFARPGDRRELAFAALTTTTLVALLGEAAVYGKPVHERYLFYVVPLLALAFGLYARRGWPRRLRHALIGVVLLVLASTTPLTDLGERGETNSATLVAVHWLRNHSSTPGQASLYVLLALTAATLVLIVLSARPAPATAFATTFAVALAAVGSAASAAYTTHQARSAKVDFFGSHPRTWIDRQGSSPVTLLESFGDRRLDAMSQLFWNRTATRVASLPGAQGIDAFGQPRARIAPDGTLTVAGKAPRGRVAVDGYEAWVQLAGAHRVASVRSYDLWRVDGRLRLQLYFPGRYRDGWTSPLAAAEVWSAHGGTVRFTVTLPHASDPTTLAAKLPSGRLLKFRLHPGATRAVTLPVCHGGHEEIKLYFSTRGFVDGRMVSAQTGAPRFTPGAGC